MDKVTPFDIKPEREWKDLVTRVANATMMATSLMDVNGNILLGHGDRYTLCARIRDDEEALTSVCKQTAAAMFAEVERTRAPAIDVCEAGMTRMVVPIIAYDRVIGQIAACGRIPEGEEPEFFLISKLLGMDEDEARKLSGDHPTVGEVYVQRIADRLHGMLSREHALQTEDEMLGR